MILAVDDEPQILDLYEEALIEQGLKQVLKSPCPHNAIKIIQEYSIETVLTDFVMPCMSGVEFIEQLLRQPNCPKKIIMISGSPRWSIKLDEIESQCEEKGVIFVFQPKTLFIKGLFKMAI